MSWAGRGLPDIGGIQTEIGQPPDRDMTKEPQQKVRVAQITCKGPSSPDSVRLC